MARPTQPLVWHQLRFALPLAQDAAVGLVERLLADGSLGRVVLELRACGGQAVWAVGSQAGERLVSVVRELVPGCRVSRGFSRRAVDQAVVVSARPVGTPLATERLSAVVRAVLAAVAVTAEGEELVVQLQLGRRFAPQALGRVEPQGWLELLGLVPIPSVSGERGRRMRAQVGRHRAAVCLRLGVRAASPLRQRTLLQGLLGALRLLEGPGVRLRARTEHPAKLNGVRRPWRAGLELGAGEIVAMAGWPVGEGALPATPSAHPRVLPLPQARETQRAFATGADPLGTGQFWAAYEALSEAQRQQWVGPVLTRLQPFLIRPHLRATLGQAAPSFDLGEVFTRRRIVLVSLNKGMLGAESARLLGSLLVGQLWPLILARAAVEPSRRHVVSVFIDEVQDYLSLPGSLADALAQARSLGAAFHLAHQYRGQLPTALKAGIDANARNKIIFSLSAADAAELARQAIDLEAADFQLLPRFGVYARTMHHGQENPWCHATTLPPTPPVQDALALRASSQARYGQDAAQVEAALLARIGQNGEMTGDDVTRTATDDATGERGGEATNDGTGPATGASATAPGVVFGRRPDRRSGGTG